MVSFISSFGINNVVVLDPNFLFRIAALVVDSAPANPNDMITLFSSSVIAFSINGKPVFINGSRSLSRNPPDRAI